MAKLGTIERLPTGILGWDKLIEGGIRKNSINLICGASGTGKSTVARQTVAAALKRGEKCLIITTSEPEEAVIGAGDEMGLAFREAVERGQLKVIEFRKIHDVIGNLKKKVDDADKWVIMLKDLRDAVKNGVSFVAIDSISSFTDIDGIKRGSIEALFNELRDLGATTIVVGESREGQAGLTVDGLSEFMADSITLLKKKTIGTNEERTLSVEKMRLTNVVGGMFKITITQQGIVVSAK